MPDRILIDGECKTLKFWGWPFPPEVRLTKGCHFAGSSTATQRGYSSTWQVIDGRLYLAGFGGTIRCFGSDEVRQVSKETFFPGTEPTFAYWMDHTFKIGIGDVVGYSHGGAGYHYDKYRYLYIHRGIVVRDEIRLNSEISEEDKARYRKHGNPW
ncbi:hypothetical protein [Methylobacterium sp. 37f]|uniref:hypothetical protein n=1 Tax=Methylobacterium sp. 37f TaxID=2817058 RepID=UPI001FFD000B|nr:hypothetical protein [Methylobacterium sp. 37f]MCK2054763.1 hypothetical protein [Methylobacterium sp. 37f]